MEIKKNVRKIFFWLSCLTIGLFLYWYLHKTIKNTSTNVSLLLSGTDLPLAYEFENIDSASLKNEISSYITQQFSNGNLLPFREQDFYSDIKAHFNVVKAISYHYQPKKRRLIKIKGITPMFMVNDTYFVGENRVLYDKILLATDTQEQIPTVSINPQFLVNNCNEKAFNLITSLSNNLLKLFKLDYQHPQEIHLRKNHQFGQLHLIASEKTIFDYEKFAYLGTIEKDLLVKKSLSEKKLYEFVFDMRFKKRVIAKIIDLGMRGRKK